MIDSNPSIFRRLGAVVLLATVLVAAPLSAQQVDNVLNNFKLNGDFVLELGGQSLENAEIYLSDRAAAYLLIAPELSSPLMVSPRTQAVESVPFMKVLKRDGGYIDILADAQLQRVSSFQLQQQDVIFTVKGQEARLKPRPWLLGKQAGDELKSHNPEYRMKAEGYGPQSVLVDSLRQQGKSVKVMVYFGSWCPVCKRLVPNVLAVEDRLGESKVSFEYYGLPRPMTEDPEAERVDIHGVPTGVVYVDGKEAGRLSGNDFNVPEASLKRILGL